MYSTEEEYFVKKRCDKKTMKVVEILENFENILKEKNSLLEQRRLFEMKTGRNIEKGSIKTEGKTKRKEIYEEEKRNL